MSDNISSEEQEAAVAENGESQEETKVPDSYYTAGSNEVATETALTLKRLETRRQLTRNCHRLVLVLVGLPARGKSFLARKLQAYLTWYGTHCKIFNVGKYRREAYAQLIQQKEEELHKQQSGDDNPDDSNSKERLQTGACDASFFDAENKEAAALREHVAEVALRDMLRWLDEDEADEDDSEEGYDEEVGASRHSTIDSSHHSRMTSVSARAGIQRDNTWIRDRIAIFDATNSTEKRRQWLLEECTSPEKRMNKATGLVFVESVCDDQELLDQNFHFKVTNSPDFKGMTYEEAIEDLKKRVSKYEAQYETMADDTQSYIKVYNLSTKLLVNHIYGRMSKIIVPALMAWNISTRPVFLCRPGETPYGVITDLEDYISGSMHHQSQANNQEQKPTHQNTNSSVMFDLSTTQMENSSDGRRGRNSKNSRAFSLGVSGKKFSDALLEFLAKEGLDFLSKRASVADMRHTGTSISGLAPVESLYLTEGEGVNPLLQQSESHDDYHRSKYPPFPLKIFTSTMPRARQTVEWEECDFRVEEFSNLNPLDKGDFAGMELDEIKRTNPRWYEKLERDPFHTRFPGGECYRDLIRRLESVIIDLEQQVIPVLVVSHVSILQTLMAYFRNSDVEKCTSIEVPLHTVIKYTPVRGGGWIESQHPIAPITNIMFPTVTSESDMSVLSACADDITLPTTIDSTSSPKIATPIWGDHVLQRKLSEQFA